eukprot:comp17822_c0_seq1/m.17944 comp17822_c0_seq1/g.17944  ORF comp17822_c0_seq1/g.17944 comp17822_c0_seq1/m.17944 type:complete len:313 (-) comp17822_c0_seq1:301-1239(-)
MVSSDQTELFRAMVKATRKRVGQPRASTSITTDILKQSAKKKGTPFGRQAREIAHSISKLQNFIDDVKKDYLDLSRQVTASEGRMTERERDQVEKEAQDLAFVCNSAISTLRSEADTIMQVEGKNHLAQLNEHRQGVILLLQEYLAKTTRQLQLLQSARARLAQERQRMARPQLKTTAQQKGVKTTIATPDDLYGTPDEEFESSLSVEERLVLEQENHRLLEELNELTDSVKEAEKKVIEIARLHQIFSENVLKQAHDLDHIYDTTVETTENVVAGNEKLQQAINDGFDFRVWVLFFLLMCSFSLLFLDWYG